MRFRALSLSLAAVLAFACTDQPLTSPDALSVSPNFNANPVVERVSAGSNDACALLQDGAVWCWGYNERGQVGNGAPDLYSVPVPVVGLDDATAISVGQKHSCAIRADSTVWCWGGNYCGQLGNASNQDSAVPVEVAGLTDVVAVTAAYGFSCAALANGTVRCWGCQRRS